MSDNTQMKTCPQCEGVGQEDVGAIPVTCRKCKGAGEVVSMHRAASFLHGGEELEKHAQTDDLSEEDGQLVPGEYDGAKPEAPEDDERLVAGFYTMSILRSDLTDQELKGGIFSALKGLSPEELQTALNEVCELAGTSIDQAMAKCRQESDITYGVKRYVYMAVDDMDRAKLRDFYRTLRSISRGE
jgi:hypothetical protein